METDRRIDRLSVCVGALLSAHFSITSAPPGSSVYWWLEKDERYEAEESVCYINQFLTGEWTWRILAGRRIECVCLLPWGPEIIMWVLLFKEHRLLQKLYVCAHTCLINISVIVRDKQRLGAINKCSNSRYSLLPVRLTTCSFLDFYSSPSCQVNPSIFRFLCLSPCLSLFHPTPTCLLYCSVLWLDESSSRTTLTLSELVIPLAISTRPGREKKGGRGAFPSVPYPLRGGRSGNDFAS